MRFFLLVALSGCAGLNLKLINASVKKPSNVAVYFTVDRRNGDPVPGLSVEQFVIYEDGKPVSKFESKQTILNPEVAAAHYTLLLVDMSGSVTGAGAVPALQAAAQAFVEQVQQFQKVAVYAFDGSATLTPIVPFTGSQASAEGGIGRLSSFHPKDPSTNLNGAVVQGLSTLRTALDKTRQPLRFGTLVVFTDGTDRAARVTKEQLRRALYESNFDVFAIGVGSEIDPSELADIGRTGTVVEQSDAAIKIAFDKIAQRVIGFTKRFYLLGYCSPARARAHRVEIEAVTEDGAHGRLSYQFDAAGFQPACDPKTPPSFDLTLKSVAR